MIDKAQAKSLGLLETRSMVAGMSAMDAAAKHSAVKAVGQPVCPGKYLVFLTGSVAAVQSALHEAKAQAGLTAMSALFLPAVHDDIWPALTGACPGCASDGIAALETHSASPALETADLIAKGAAVRLLRIRLASGLGGRGLVICSGAVASLTQAAEIAREKLGHDLAAARVIPAPHPRLWELTL